MYSRGTVRGMVRLTIKGAVRGMVRITFNGIMRIKVKGMLRINSLFYNYFNLQ